MMASVHPASSSRSASKEASARHRLSPPARPHWPPHIAAMIKPLCAPAAEAPCFPAARVRNEGHEGHDGQQETHHEAAHRHERKLHAYSHPSESRGLACAAPSERHRARHGAGDGARHSERRRAAGSAASPHAHPAVSSGLSGFEFLKRRTAGPVHRSAPSRTGRRTNAYEGGEAAVCLSRSFS